MTNPRIGTSFDSFLEEDGLREEVDVLAQKLRNHEELTRDDTAVGSKGVPPPRSPALGGVGPGRKAPDAGSQVAVVRVGPAGGA